MNRSNTAKNDEIKRPGIKQESINYGYEDPFSTYTSSSSSSTVAQPLPGQPPLPPMPPPSSGIPPPPHVFGPMPSQVTPIQAWTQWHWVTPQPCHFQPPSREITGTFQREMALRNNYIRRDRFTHNKGNPYTQGHNYQRKNRRPSRFGQTQNQFNQATYLGAPLTSNSLGLEWQRNSYASSTNETIMNHLPVSLPNHSIPAGIITNRHGEEASDQDVKIVLEEVVVKKNKQRKPMSQSYPSRPWNREDAERALKIENDYNKTVKAQSLIIKFPDPDLNKDIVREFHPGIQNIHFQSPSGPRYCFIQMAEGVDIDKAIKELEEIHFGVGHLKVERKSLKDEDNPMPEEIDPYTLYIGNLPESVNVNEVKSKFPTAARVDVGYAQKMRNTRYAFIRYNSVDESIAAYKQAHNLMWGTRSIIVRFRRQRGNTCLPGEPKPNVKKLKEESTSNSQVKKEQKANHTDKDVVKLETDVENRLQDNSNKVQNKVLAQIQERNTNLQSSSSSPTSIASAKSTEQQQQQPWTGQPPQIPSASEAPPPCSTEEESAPETIMLTEIKEEPIDYDDDMSCGIPSDDEIDDDDDECDVEVDETESENSDNDYDVDFEEDEDEDVDESDKQEEKTEESSNNLDEIFSGLENLKPMEKKNKNIEKMGSMVNV